jgi:2-iminobutanoate/2-iminopropanoate deaminase
MIEKIINPKDGIYHATDDYVHAIEVQGMTRQLFVSGTMGLDVDGKAPRELDEQLVLVWANIRRILSEAKMTNENIVRVTSYLTKPEYAQKNQDARLLALGDRRVPTTAIVVDTLTPDWLIEIEIIAAA